MKLIKLFMLIFNLVLILLVLLIALNNPEPVTFDYVIGDIQLPLSALLAIACSVGIVLVAPYFALKAGFLAKSNRRLRKQILQQEEDTKKERIAEQFYAEQEKYGKR